MRVDDQLLAQAFAIAQQWSRQSARRHRRKHNQRRVRRALKGVAFLVVVTFLVVPALVAAGFMFGPYGLVGLFAAPLLLVVMWIVVLWLSLKLPTQKPASLLAKSELTKLPQETEEWIEQERRLLPSGAQNQLDQIGQHLLLLAPQLSGLGEQSPAGVEVRRLLGEELPALVQRYKRLPETVVRTPLYEGKSPELQLVAGLEIVDQQLTRIHRRLAQQDLHALAAHQRFLELKYKSQDERE